jgi:hypothetical protein
MMAIEQEPATPKVEVRYTVTIQLPERDLDLLDSGLMTREIEERLTDMMAHYEPKVERNSRDWEIEAQKRWNKSWSEGIAKYGVEQFLGEEKGIDLSGGPCGVGGPREATSNCVLDKYHEGEHRDSSGGAWIQAERPRRFPRGE